LIAAKMMLKTKSLL